MHTQCRAKIVKTTGSIVVTACVARITRSVVDDIAAAIPGRRATVTPVLPD